MIRELFRYIWGSIAHPNATFDDLARQTSIRPAVMLALLVQLLFYLNLVIFTFCGYDWLGTRPDLADPTYVGFIGRMPLGMGSYLPVFFFVISPLLALLGLVLVPGIAQVLSKLWRGHGTFEQMVNTLAYAQAPAQLFYAVLNDMLIAGMPANLLAGHPYAFTAALNGEFGSLFVTISWVYMFGFYIFGAGLWTVILGTVAIRRVQGIPYMAAVLIMLFTYILWFYGIGGSFVR